MKVCNSRGVATMYELTQNEIDVLLRYVASPEEVKEGSTQRRF